MAIISVQSQVIAGFVGNSAAVPVLQMRGHEVFGVPTVVLSHHPGHGGAKGAAVPGGWFDAFLEGMAARGCFGRCEAVLSGYLGGGAAGDFVARVVERVGGEGIFLCDPVLGDDGRCYVSEEAEAGVRRLAGRADILTPNAFELARLSGREVGDRAEAVAAMRGLGRRIVVVTGFVGRDTPAGVLDVLAAEGEAVWRVGVPKLAQKFSGAGDVFAALFLSFWLRERDVRRALGESCALLQEVLIQTRNLGLDELALVACRHQLMYSGLPVFAEPLG